MDSIFTKIIKGEIPCYKIAEDDKFIAFLDINPLSEGHTLVVPKQQTDYVFDLENALLGELMNFAKKVAKSIEQVVSCKRIGVVVYGLDVPHAHVHLIPLVDGGEINFTRPKLELSQDEFIDLAEKISKKFNGQ